MSILEKALEDTPGLKGGTVYQLFLLNGVPDWAALGRMSEESWQDRPS